MKIAILDAETLGNDLSLNLFNDLGECNVYKTTAPEQVADHIVDCNVVIINKICLNENNMKLATQLQLICVAATGYDNIDVNYCKKAGIGVCNVAGYSTDSVAQLTVAMVMSLSVHLHEYNSFVRNGNYCKCGVANKLEPVYHELAGKTWGIVGMGNIGSKVAMVASAFSCNIICCKRTPVTEYTCTDINSLCASSDIITIHTPLTKETHGFIGKEQIALMKKSVILVNAARGAVTDEAEIAKAVTANRIGAFGTDVYTTEPFSEDHPFYNIKDLPNVCLTPHMAWGAYEARIRCISSIKDNIESFYSGGYKGRIDI